MDIDGSFDGNVVGRAVAEFGERAPADDVSIELGDGDGVFFRWMGGEPGLAGFDRFRFELVRAGGAGDVVVVDVVDGGQVFFVRHADLQFGIHSSRAGREAYPTAAR